MTLFEESMTEMLSVCDRRVSLAVLLLLTISVNIVLIKQRKHTLTWFWSEETWLKSVPVLSLTSLGLSVKLKGSALVVWASTLGSSGSWFASVQRQLHFPTFSALNRGFTHKAHTHHKLVSMYLGKCCFFSVGHRFGFCLTLKLNSLFHTVIY